MSQFLLELQATSPFEWLAVLTGLAYVLLSARNNPWCWPLGIVSCAVWAWVTYNDYKLFADALLQVFYVAMGVWGWYNWIKKDATAASLTPITRLSSRAHVLYIALGVVGSLMVGYFFSFTAAAATYWDAFTTVFAVLATVMLVRRQLENWLYWIVIDLAYVGLYYSRGAMLFAVLMAIYVFIAIQGYFYWRNQLARSATD